MFLHISRFVHLTYFAHFVHLTYCMHFTIPQFAFCALAYLARFRISYFSRFDMRYRAPPRDPLHSVHMSCPHLPRSIGAYFTLFHSHYIIYVFTFPFMFTYLIMCLYHITLVCLALPTWFRALGTYLAC
jgi:hypothetical protein